MKRHTQKTLLLLILIQGNFGMRLIQMLEKRITQKSIEKGFQRLASQTDVNRNQNNLVRDFVDFEVNRARHNSRNIANLPIPNRKTFKIRDYESTGNFHRNFEGQIEGENMYEMMQRLRIEKL